jgi:UDP-N-acetylmuramoylalanine--D-glutamate ligase
VERLPSRAPHNLLNSLAAAGLARSLGIACGDIESGLASFQIDHHRMEKILDQDGITWINDSKATNPHAALSALLSCEKVIWIAGGLAKGAAMDELARAAHRRIDAAILIGTDALLIRDALIEQKPSLKVIECDSSLRGEELMTQVVTYAKNLASKGQTVLLAPACASMDQFSSYAERGELFSKKVKELVAS